MNPPPFLVVDKKGIIGGAICSELLSKSPVVYVSQKQPELAGIEFVAFDSEIPVIPNYKYSHIILVDYYTEEKYLSEFIKKAEKDRAVFVIITNLTDYSSFYKRTKSVLGKAKIVIIGDIVSRDVCPLIIYNAIKFGKVKIAGDGLSRTYPVFLDDAVSGIIEAVFDENTKSSVFYLFPKNPPTELSLSRMIQKANPNVRVDFIKQHKKKVEITIPSGGRYLLLENYILSKKIRELNIESLMDKHFKINSFYVNMKIKKRRFWSFKKLLLAFFLLLVLPFSFTLIFSFFGFVVLGNAKITIEKGDIANAQKSANIAKILFSLARKSSAPLLVQMKFIGQENSLDVITKKINLGFDLSQIVIHITDGSRVLSGVFVGRSKNPRDDFEKGATDLKKAITIFRQIEAESKLPSDISAKIKSVDTLVKIAENTIDYLPNLFGFNGKKVYLILFQNNMELRPGGGFIGSYGLLTFYDGKIEDFSIHDVYDADGQLRGHIEPPFPIRRYLKLPHLFLRDSNFDVDFAKGASSSALLLNAETGQMVDGVIGVDVSFAKSILNGIGPIYVTDYKETITASNLYELMQSHVEKNFFPGSRQKKDFLRSLFSAMQSKISANDNLSYFKIAKSINEAIVQKHLLFAFSDKNLQDIYTVNKWSSALWDERRKSVNSINDFIGINEANLGVNKSNYFVKRNIIHNVKIDEDRNTTGEISIEYDNASNKWPGGDYINYLRIILPINTTISSISFDGVSQKLTLAITDPLIYETKDFIAPLELELEKYVQNEKTVYGFLVKVKAMTSKKIKIEYLAPQNISSEISELLSYNLRIFKQPGTDSYPYSFTLTYPENIILINRNSSISTLLESDMDLNFTFTQR